MKVLIIEDEQPVARHLTRLLQRYDPTTEVLATLSTVVEAVQWFKANDPPDVVFLDIHLGDTLSFKIVEQVDINAPIIFTTAYDQYALEAFKVNSIDYLLKPIDLDSLKKAFEKLQRLTAPSAGQTISADQIMNAWKLLRQPFKSRFVVKIGDHIRWVPTEEILFFYSRHKLTYLVNAEGRSYPTEYSLSDVETLVDPLRFFRINRQYIISTEAIREIVMYSNSRLKVVLDHPGPEDVIVSRERVTDFKDWLDQ